MPKPVPAAAEPEYDDEEYYDEQYDDEEDSEDETAFANKFAKVKGQSTKLTT